MAGVIVRPAGRDLAQSGFGVSPWLLVWVFSFAGEAYHVEQRKSIEHCCL